MGPRPGRTKTAVDRVERGKERRVNIRFLAMANHYVFEPEFCNPAAGWEKGQVEKNVQDSRHQVLQGMPDFPDLDALNAWLEQRCVELWHETAHGTLPGTIADVWAEEKPALMPLPVAFDGFIEQSKRVSPTCLICFEREEDQETVQWTVSPTQGYSVSASSNRPISLRIYPDRLVVVLKARLRRDAAEGQILCEHPRIIERSHHLPPRTIYDWRHYLAVVQRKPGALRNGAPFLELPSAFRQLQAQMAHVDRAAIERWSTSLRGRSSRRGGRARRRGNGFGRGPRSEEGATKTHVLNLVRTG